MKPVLTLFIFLVMLAGAGLAAQVIPPGEAKDTSAVAAAGLSARPDSVLTVQGKSSLMPAERRWGDAGVGIGQDYGGFGIKGTFYPVKYLGVFGAAGFEIAGVSKAGFDMLGFGWNVGVLARACAADGRHGARPYLKMMYGVNSGSHVKGTTSYDKLFYGFTAGIGAEFRFGKNKRQGLNIDLNVPLRTAKFFEQVNAMKKDPSVSNVKSFPVAVSIGYMAEF